MTTDINIPFPFVEDDRTACDRSEIFCCAVNGTHAEELKKERPLSMHCGVAIVYYLEKKTGQCSILTPVTYSVMEELGLEEEELGVLAWTNTLLQKRALFAPLSEVLEEGKYESLYVLSNSEMHLGAVAVFYPGLLTEIARELDSDLFILPSSIHECLLLPDRGDVSADYLRKIVRNVNDTEVDEEEILSYSIYRYSRKDDTLMIDNS